MKITKGKVLLTSLAVNELDFFSGILSKGGYETFCTELDSLLEYAYKVNPFAIIVHAELPDKRIFETCKELRAFSDFDAVSITLLSGINTDEVVVRSFDSGIDFFVEKPVKPKLFLTKMDSVNRKYRRVTNFVSPFGNIVIDREKYLAYYNNAAIFFPPKQFELLALLIAKNGKIVLRSEIMNHIWGFEQNNYIRTIDAHIYSIRRKLGRDCIRTIKGVGYLISI